MDTGLESWDSLYRFADPAVRASRELVRTAILACFRIQQHSNRGNNIVWPFPDGFDNLLWSRATRREWQRAARVR